jgi:hypothetical protein
MSASLTDDLIAWLAGRASLTVGTAVFRGSRPEDATLATAIVPTGGPARPYGHVFAATFQVLTRGSAGGLAEPLARAWALYAALYPAGLPLRNVALNTDWRLLAADAIQPPADAGLTEGGKRIVSWNFQVKALRRA